jgi:hypothetical protein
VRRRGIMRTRGKVLTRASLLCAAIPVLAAFASDQTQAEIACNKIGGSVGYYGLGIDANGSKGQIYCGALSTNSDGSVSATCEARFTGEPNDPVKLTCKNRHVTFTRTRTGGFTQNYSGWMYVGNSLAIAGDFSHNSTERMYGWCGQFFPIIQ